MNMRHVLKPIRCQAGVLHFEKIKFSIFCRIVTCVDRNSGIYFKFVWIVKYLGVVFSIVVVETLSMSLGYGIQFSISVEF